MNCYNCNSKKLVCDVQKDAYVCQDCGYEYPKQYFFISHSHKDIEKVRIVRNIVEETFFYEPILFFLKCLSNKNEVEELVKREIEERIWFVYCNSKNAQESEYVQFERQYLDSLLQKGKKFNVLTVELDDFDIWDEECIDYIRRQIAYKIRKTKIFLCYSAVDRKTVDVLKSGLRANGYSVWTDVDELKLGDDWSNSVSSAIKGHSRKDGAVLMVITPNTIKSKCVQREMDFALAEGAVVIPLIVTKREEKEEVLKKFLKEFVEFSKKDLLTVGEDEIVGRMPEITKYIQRF